MALFLWLLPLIGVAITSVRPASDLAQGNYFGMPSYLAFDNYVDIFHNTPMSAVHAQLVQGDHSDGHRQRLRCPA